MQNRVGKLIREARGEMTLSKFSVLTGVNAQTISRYEKGVNPNTKKALHYYNPHILLKLSAKGRIPIADLLFAALKDLDSK
jgi:transcriptional regulator with XRE-family HTH domain